MGKLKNWYDGITAVRMIKYAAFLYILITYAKALGGIAGFIAAAVR